MYVSLAPVIVDHPGALLRKDAKTKLPKGVKLAIDDAPAPLAWTTKGSARHEKVLIMALNSQTAADEEEKNEGPSPLKRSRST